MTCLQLCGALNHYQNNPHIFILKSWQTYLQFK